MEGDMDREQMIAAMTARRPVAVQLSFGTAYVLPLMRSQFDKCTELASRLQKETTASRAGAVRWYAIKESWVDKDGVQILKEEDRDAFDKFSAADTERLFEKILDVSAVSKEDRDFLSVD
jgi:hypothetical protein